MCQTEWDVKMESKLKAIYETRPGPLVQDKHAIVLKYNDVAVAHVPKSLSKIIYFIGNTEKISS